MTAATAATTVTVGTEEALNTLTRRNAHGMFWDASWGATSAMTERRMLGLASPLQALANVKRAGICSAAPDARHRRIVRITSVCIRF